MKVFVTGGSGLVGSHVVEELRARGWPVVALHRESSDTGFLRARGCSLVEGDVRNPTGSLARAMAGCDAVVHAAALVYPDAPRSLVREVNVTGSDRVLRAAARAGARRAVHLSSVAVYGDRPGRLDESTPLDWPLPSRDLYARSKREAEAAVGRVRREVGLEVTVLRPPALYGERDRLMVPMLARLLALPLVPLLGSGRNTVPVAYAGNVVGAVVACLEGRASRPVYNVTDDGPLTQRELLEGLARGLGRRPRFVPIPAALVEGASRIAGVLGAAVPGARDLPPERLGRLALGDDPYSGDLARKELAWTPRSSHPEALARTGAWFRERGWG